MRPGLPAIDGDTAPFWVACKEGRLVLQRCLDCDALQHYPRSLCLSCASQRLDFVDASGSGVVHSYTVVHRSPDPERLPAPYVVALIRLDEGPMIMSNVIGADPETIYCEQPVTVEFVDLEDGNRLPVFRPATG
jgi:uncharacterized OB-fold protein